MLFLIIYRVNCYIIVYHIKMSVSCTNAIINNIVFIESLVIVAFLFSPLGGGGSRSQDTSGVWKRRCRVICCGCGSSDESMSDAYKDIANLVSSFFEVTQPLQRIFYHNRQALSYSLTKYESCGRHSV